MASLPLPKPWPLLVFVLLCFGCEGSPGSTVGGAGSSGDHALIRAESVDGTFSVVLPDDLQIHPLTGAVMGTTVDGAFRIYIAEIEPDTLLRMAGAGKGTLIARGWRVDGEQHLEKAVQASLTRGGTMAKPAEFRDSWWFVKGETAYLCDGIARPESAHRLGDSLRTLCQQVSARSQDTAAEPDANVNSP